VETDAKRVLRGRRISLPLKLGGVLGLSIFLIEIALMLLPFPSRLGVWEALFDAGLLTLLVSPILYVSLLRPLAAEIAERDRAQRGLLEAQRDLERQVEERTKRLSESLSALHHQVAERELVEQELMRFKLGIERSGEAVFMTAVDGEIIYANPAFEELFGFSREDWQGKTPRILKSGRLPQPVYEHFWSTLLGRQVVAGELINKTKDGRLLTVQSSANPILDENGELLGFLAIQRDVTAQKQAEAALRESELQLQAAQRLAGIGSWSWDIATDAVTWSKELYAIHGFDPELPAPSFAEQPAWYTPESWSALSQAVERAVRAGEAYELELEIIRRDGEHRWITALGAPVRDEGGQIRGLHGTAQDIEEQKQAALRLKESEETWRTLVNSNPESLFLVDTEGTVLVANEAAAARVGRRVEDLVGANVRELLPEEAAAARLRVMEEVARIGGPVRFEHRLHDRYIDYHVHPVFDGQGRVAKLAVLGVDLTERRQAEEAMRRRLAELEALHTVSGALRTAETRDEALPILLDETLAALETDAGIVWLYHPESDELRAAVSRGWFQSFALTSMEPAEGIAGAVFAGGQAHVSAEFARDPLVRQPATGMIPSGWGGVCVPIRTGEIAIGVLLVSVPPGHPVTTEQVRLLESLAEMAGAALHRVSLHEETVRQLDRLRAMHRVDQAISAGTDLRLTLSVLLEHVASQLQVDAADVLLLNQYTLTLEHTAGRGFHTPAAERAHIRLGESLAGRAALERRAVQAVDPAQMQESPQLAALQAVEGFVAYHAVPLIAKGQVVGVLEVFHRSPLAVGPDWLDLLETLAGQAAIAIENAQLFDHLQRSNLDLALAYDATIEGWSHALDLRDKETKGHTLRVTEQTMRLARALGIADAELVHIRRGALLHDIGKMGVPDGILLKPGPLSEEEWVLMRRHPQLAYDLLAPIDYLRPALDIPLCHHERWDGTGYPRGLAGEQIPLVARLFAVVDVWDALRSDRPYRKAWTEEKTLEHIRSSAGTHFDPKVVELFLDTMNKGAGRGQRAG
jgi:PAS domain S-box-containing protein